MILFLWLSVVCFVDSVEISSIEDTNAEKVPYVEMQDSTSSRRLLLPTFDEDPPPILVEPTVSAPKAVTDAWSEQNMKIRKGKLSLVFNHYAPRPMPKKDEDSGVFGSDLYMLRRRQIEVESAIAVNMLNPFFGEILVWYEERPDYTCANFTASVKAATDRLHGARKRHAYLKKKLSRDDTVLRCVPRTGPQATFYEVMHFAVETAAYELVLVSLSDIVFDYTIAQMPLLSPGDLHTVTVNHRPDPALYYTQFSKVYKGDNVDHYGLGRCGRADKEQHPIKKANKNVTQNEWETHSWDGYFFNRTDLNQTFIQNYKYCLDKPTGVCQVTLNMGFSDNSFACMLRDAGVRVRNSCGMIRVRHYDFVPRKTGLKKALDYVDYKFHEAKDRSCMMQSICEFHEVPKGLKFKVEQIDPNTAKWCELRKSQANDDMSISTKK